MEFSIVLPLLTGLGLSLGVAAMARGVGLDRDRAFYPTVLMVVASYNVLFAAMTGSVETVLAESVVMIAFVAAAIGGFKVNPWIVVAGLAGHGALDAVHGHLLNNPGVPAWWPPFCFAYDVGAAAGLAWLMRFAELRSSSR
jgi:hypothetical protein